MSKVIRNICGGNLINALISACAFEKIKERLKSLRKEDSAQKEVRATASLIVKYCARQLKLLDIGILYE